MRNLLDDIKFALRLQAKSPGFTALSVLIMALGVGATTAAFSELNAVMLRPLPYADSSRIVIPWRLAPSNLNLGYAEIPWGIDDFHQLASSSKTFASLASFKPDSYNFTGAGEPIFLEGVRASWQFFRVLGVRPAIGRAFTAEDDSPSNEHEVILSDALWSERFNRDLGVLGKSFNLNGQPYTVVGVMPPGFAFPRGEEMPDSFGFSSRPEVWIPLALPAVRPPNYPDELAVMGRLSGNASVTQLQAEMTLFKARMEREDASSKGWYNSRVTPLTQQVIGPTKMPLLLTLAAGSVVLLIASANIANLLFARSLRRQSEFALRAALGAGKGRLIRQLLSESLLLALTGGGLGVGLAALAIRLIKVFGPAGVPRLQEANLDLTVLAFALMSTLASAMFFGLLPALVMLRQDLNKSLREGGRGRVGSLAASKIRSGLLVFEVALALVLVIASGLLTQTFFRLLSVDPGFKPDHVFTFALSLPETKYRQGGIANFYQQVLNRLGGMPGVESAGLVGTVPMDGATNGIEVSVPGRPAEKGDTPVANYTVSSAGYFSTVRTPLLRGRDFEVSDSARSTSVAIINQSMARKFWPGEDPIGKKLSPGSPDAPSVMVVGIVANSKHLSAREEPGPEMYVPYTQRPLLSMAVMHFVLRSKADASSLTASARSAVHSLDPDLPLVKTTTLQTILDNSLIAQRFSMWLLAAFSAMSLLLAAFGLYAAISYSVGQRTREIGIRLALGAESRNVLGMVVGQGARLACMGIVIGLATAACVTQLMVSFLYGVRPTDAMTFICVSLLLLIVTLLASYLPARRAARIDPAMALRQE